jgi:PAS domain S-box-containing protein
VKDVSGHPLYRVAIVQEVTNRKRAEETLRESEERFGMLASATFEGIVITEGGRIADLNEQLAKMLGFERQEMIGKEISSFLLAEERGLVLANICNGIESRVEHRMLCKDGRQITVEAHGQTAKYRDRTLRFTAIRDVTERKQAEQALLRSEKLASVGQMAATIGHEINNPLDAVMNMLFIAKSINDPESVRQYLEMADGELKRIAHITRQSLGFYRESNAPALTSINAVMESAVDLLKSRIKAKHAIIEKQWDDDVEVTAIAGELRQAFSNLLANSLDAIDAAGTIKLRVSAGAAFNNGHPCVRVTVADNGKGIDASSRQQIFEPLFTTKGTVGTGLGLWVSKRIIEKHGGTIHMRSSTNGTRRGTVFSVTLPAEPVAARSQAAGA